MGGEECGSASGRVLGWSLAACIVVALTTIASAGSLLPGGQGDYTDQWAVQVLGGEKTARAVADELGYDFKGQIGAIQDHYLLSKRNHPRRSRRSASIHTRALQEDTRVHWAEQQVAIKRMKRDFISKRDEIRAYREIRFKDTDWAKEWYLHDDGYRDAEQAHMDLGVLPVWSKQITGRGVTVCVLDDGIECNHTDIAPNYEPRASIDLNDEDNDPTPRYDFTNENKHGTRCAGEIAMVANNDKCGVGVAYNSKIGGVRMLDGVVTDSLEARALSHALDVVDIFSASWGPNDDGRTVEGPGKLASAAFEEGIKKGRGGKGAIYVWASGNGGMHGDNCDCDGYTGSIYTLSVSSASQHCQSPWYAEPCASTMATTYSSGTLSDRKIISTDLHDTCTNSHTGTSASAPLAAGIVALLLEANPKLTWRDVQHLIAWTSDYVPLADNKGWKTNGAGLMVNSHFGFGLLNAANLVNAADPAVYEPVPKKNICEVEPDPSTGALPKTIIQGEELQFKITTSGCDQQENTVRSLEHVQLILTMAAARRGALQIYLTSPAGTEVNILTKRAEDMSSQGFNNWPFMSVHTWGEDPKGTWLLRIRDTDSMGKNVGEVKDVRLVLHGMAKQPPHMRKAGGRRDYGDVTERLRAIKRGRASLEEGEITPWDEQQQQEGGDHEKLKPREQLESALEKLKGYLKSGDYADLLSSRSRGRGKHPHLNDSPIAPPASPQEAAPAQEEGSDSEQLNELDPDLPVLGGKLDYSPLEGLSPSDYAEYDGGGGAVLGRGDYLDYGNGQDRLNYSQ